MRDEYGRSNAGSQICTSTRRSGSFVRLSSRAKSSREWSRSDSATCRSSSSSIRPTSPCADTKVAPAPAMPATSSAPSSATSRRRRIEFTGLPPPCARGNERFGAAVRRSCLVAAQAIAEAAHGEDGLVAELAPQVVDVDLDGVAADRLVPAVQLFLELGTRHDR